jgi:hypothetical protein
MSDNLELWGRFADIDPKFTKPITGRDYKGTSPNPQYVIRCLTEMFGPVGKGFGWEILKEDFTTLGGTILHWCRIRFWWKDSEGTHSVEEYGQTKAFYITSGGYERCDEDAPKKSLTDAIIKGASHMGVAANIFLGRWDDQKYVDDLKRDFAQAANGDSHTTKEPEPAPMSAHQLKKDKAWEKVTGELDNDLLDCHSLTALEVLKADYREKVVGWPKGWKSEIGEKFSIHENKLIKQRERDEANDDFPGDIRNHVLMAGE